MICPECNGKLEVVETVRDEDYVYRRRRCKSCGQIIYTIEKEVIPGTAYRTIWDTLHKNKYKERNK